MTFPRLALFAVVFVLALAGCSGCGGEAYSPEALAEREPAALARLAVVTDTTGGRAFFFSNQRGSFFYDVLAGPQTEAAMGYVVGGYRMLDGWRWFVGDTLSLGPSTVVGGVIRPDFTARTYAEPDTGGFFGRMVRRFQGPELKRFNEIVTLFDDALVVEVPDSTGTLALYPVLSDQRADGYRAEVRGDALGIARTNYLQRREGETRPVWLAVVATDGTAVARRAEEGRITDLGARERGFAPGRIAFPTPGAVAFAAGDSLELAIARARRALQSREAQLARRAERLAEALDGSTIRTEDATFNRAFDWARISLDALVTGDSATLALASGIPGTDLPPGRSTLSAFEGAFLVQGRWEEARQLLLNFGRAQRRDRRIDVFGRIPNTFEGGRPQYVTNDATPVFVDAVGDYLRTTGDRGLITANGAEFWTRTVYAMRGLEDLRTPDQFLRTREGETWVQTYEGRNFEPRVNRPAEVQARYYAGYRAMAPIARIMGQLSGRPTSVAAYTDSAEVLQRRFREKFVRDGRIADVLRPTGEATPEIRPSALLALHDLDLDPEVERAVLRRTAEALAYPWGVSTRAQRDSLFHPFLNASEYYEPAQARFEGAVWTWLAGPLVSLLTEHGAADRAYEQTAYLQHLLLERGIVGAIAENVDAHPRPTERDGQPEPAVGGAPVQPWSLAEFIRNAYQDYAGIRYLAGNDVVLEPHLPAAWGTTMARFRVGNGWVRAYMDQTASQLAVSIVAEGRLPAEAQLRLRALGQEKRLPLVRMQGDTLTVPTDSVRVVLSADRITVGGETVEADDRYEVADAGFWDDFAWVEPEIQDEYPVMRQVAEARRLDAPQVARRNPTAVPILTRTDPVGDDWGTTATYTYPEGFPRGVLDVTYFEITADDSSYYFEVGLANLVDPSEMGFQPTFLALAFNTAEGGARDVGRNSR